MAASLPYRVAMRLHCLILLKNRSTRLRARYKLGLKQIGSCRLSLSDNTVYFVRGSERRKPVRDRRRYPIGLDAEIGENHLRRVVAGKAGNIAAGMAA